MQVIRGGFFFSVKTVTKVRVPAGEQLLLCCIGKQKQPIDISVCFWHLTNTAGKKQMFCFKAGIFKINYLSYSSNPWVKRVNVHT